MRRSFLILVTSAFIGLSCNQSKSATLSENNTSEHSGAINNSEEISRSSNKDYSLLYKANDTCKLTKAEVATLFGYSVNEMETNITANDYNPCSYMVTYKDGGEGVFYAKVYETAKSDNRHEINNFDQKYTLNIDGHVVWRHPNQGYFMIMHPDYDNRIRVQFRAMLGLKKDQIEILREKGLAAVRFLIAKYQD